MRHLVLLAAVVSALVWARPASAYAWMIRHDYGGCNACHADPSGGGLLTAYGRAQGETLLRTHYTKGGADEDPGTIGDFLFGAIPLPESVLLGGDIRALALYIKPQFGPSLQRNILMQADLEGQVSVDRVRVNGSAGYTHEGALAASVTHGVGDRMVSRVLWAGIDIGADREFLLRAGRINVPFGIRSIEHTFFVRASTRTDINDTQEHGVSLAYNGEKLRGELLLIAGNYQIHPDALRERGYAGYLEYLGIEHLALGASSLVTHTETDIALGTPLYRHAHGVFARWAPVEQVAILTEHDFLLQSQPPGANLAGLASLVQVDLEPLQGVHLIGAAELLDRSFSRTVPSYALWGGLAWFFLPHVDVRGDAIWQSLGAASSRSNADAFLLQLHAYL